jgi:hypothetical protein
VEGTRLAWGVGIPADLFDRYMCKNIGIYDEELIAAIRERAPEWPPPNDDVEDLDELTTRGRPRSPVSPSRRSKSR